MSDSPINSDRCEARTTEGRVCALPLTHSGCHVWTDQPSGPVPPAVERNGGACQCRDQYCPRHRSWHSGALAELEALKAGVRCTDCGNTRPQDVIDCPVCDVPRGHVHGARRDAEVDQLHKTLANLVAAATTYVDYVSDDGPAPRVGGRWWTLNEAHLAACELLHERETRAASTTQEAQ
jgi:hypothetical protein